MEKLILNAIADFNKLLSCLEKGEESNVGGSFRARCRELPNLMESVGFIPALSFCYAKATKKVYESIKNSMESRGGKINDNDHTKKGYGLFLYLVLNRLKNLKLIEADLTDPGSVLEELADGKEGIASKIIRPYIIQLKNLSEAVFRVEEER
ncbi:MAG: type III-B CRISPR module-associated protein Cmr5 [Candidatus Methanomethylicia archaeon]